MSTISISCRVCLSKCYRLPYVLTYFVVISITKMSAATFVSPILVLQYFTPNVIAKRHCLLSSIGVMQPRVEPNVLIPSWIIVSKRYPVIKVINFIKFKLHLSKFLPLCCIMDILGILRLIVLYWYDVIIICHDFEQIFLFGKYSTSFVITMNTKIKKSKKNFRSVRFWFECDQITKFFFRSLYS